MYFGESFSVPASLILAAVLAAAVQSDLKTRRIPNILTFPAMAVALALHGWAGGPQGLAFALSGLGIGFAAMLVPHLLGKMGAGDVKLMAAAGAFLGPAGALTAVLFASLAGGLLAILALIGYSGAARRTLGAFWASGMVWMSTGDIGALNIGRTEAGGPRLCYGLAIGLGTVAAMAWRLAGHSYLSLL